MNHRLKRSPGARWKAGLTEEGLSRDEHPGVHRGRSDEEIIEKGVPRLQRGAGRQAGLMRCRRVAGDWMISSRELAAFPAKFPILWRGGGKAILMARKDIRIRKVGAAGSAKHNLSGNFSPFTQSSTVSHLWSLAVIYRSGKRRIRKCVLKIFIKMSLLPDWHCCLFLSASVL